MHLIRASYCFLFSSWHSMLKFRPHSVSDCISYLTCPRDTSVLVNFSNFPFLLVHLIINVNIHWWKCHFNYTTVTRTVSILPGLWEGELMPEGNVGYLIIQQTCWAQLTGQLLQDLFHSNTIKPCTSIRWNLIKKVLWLCTWWLKINQCLL